MASEVGQEKHGARQAILITTGPKSGFLGTPISVTVASVALVMRQTGARGGTGFLKSTILQRLSLAR